MKGFEFIRALKLRMEPFSLENGLLSEYRENLGASSWLKRGT